MSYNLVSRKQVSPKSIKGNITSLKGEELSSGTVSKKTTPVFEVTSMNSQDDNFSMGDGCCPLCMEEMDASDSRFRPCPCGYQICRFCWHRIREEENQKCPACRRVYTDEDAVYLPPVNTNNIDTSASSSNSRLKKNGNTVSNNNNSSSKYTIVNAPPGVIASRRHLVEIRVIQRNLVYVIGLAATIADENILKDPAFFGQFGRVLKIVVSKRSTSLHEKTSPSGATHSGSAYVTYEKAEEATRAIQYIDGSSYDGKALRATYGTTKYCSFFLRGNSCPNSGCMYLHEEGRSDDSFTKDDLAGGKLHLHPAALGEKNLMSSMITAAHSINTRIFGTIMFSPPTPSASPSNLIPKLESCNSSIASRESNEATLGCNRVKVLSKIQSEQEIKQYEEDAKSFLSRLARWRRSSDDLQNLFPAELDSIDSKSILPTTLKSSESEKVRKDSLPIFDSIRFDPFSPALLIRDHSINSVTSLQGSPTFYDSPKITYLSNSLDDKNQQNEESRSDPPDSKFEDIKPPNAPLLGFIGSSMPSDSVSSMESSSIKDIDRKNRTISFNFHQNKSTAMSDVNSIQLKSIYQSSSMGVIGTSTLKERSPRNSFLDLPGFDWTGKIKSFQNIDRAKVNTFTRHRNCSMPISQSEENRKQQNVLLGDVLGSAKTFKSNATILDDALSEHSKTSHKKTFDASTLEMQFLRASSSSVPLVGQITQK